MPKNNSGCKKGLEKLIIKKSVFDNEIELCKKLSKKNKGCCCWGKCKNCGVLFLLYKLHKGKLVEDKSEIDRIRNKILGGLV